jgi:hypothetical protein
MSRPKQRPDQRLDQRLDDELRSAFRREQPSGDFTMRVLERVSLEPPPRLRWWQRLAMLLEPPRLRWVAIGVTASLLLAIGAVQYRRMQLVAVDTSVQVAKENPSSSAASDKVAGASGVDGPPKETVTNKSLPVVKHVSALATNHRPVSTRHQQERELRAEGEAAKEKLMFALALASSALSDAQKAVHDDGLEP